MLNTYATPLSLREHVLLFIGYYQEREWSLAAQTWQELAVVYEGEDAWIMLSSQLRAQATICMIFSHQPGAAIALIEDDDNRIQEPLAVGTILDWLYAIALEMVGDHPRAMEVYAGLAQTYAGKPEAELALYRYYDLAGDVPALLQLLQEELTLPSLQQSATLSVVRRALEEKQCSLAVSTYLQVNWDGRAQAAALEYAAVSYQLTECLIACNLWAEASWMIDQMPDAQRLQRQYKRWEKGILLQLQNKHEGVTAFVREEYFLRLLSELRRLQQALPQWEENAPGMHFQAGQVLLYAQRVYEAELVWRTLWQQRTGRWSDEALLGMMTIAANRGEDHKLRQLYAKYGGSTIQDEGLAARLVLLLAWRDFSAQRYTQVREYPDLLDPEHRIGTAYYELLLLAAHAAIMQQSWDDALGLLSNIINSGSREQRIKAEIALALCESGDGRYVDAIVRLKAISGNTTLHDLLREEASYRQVYLASLHGKDAECISYAEKYYNLVSIPKQKGEVHLLLARSLQRTGRLQEALEACKRVQPRDAHLWGRSLAMQGQWLQKGGISQQAWLHWKEAFDQPKIASVPQVFALLQQWLQVDEGRFLEEVFSQAWGRLGDEIGSDSALPLLRSVSETAYRDDRSMSPEQWLERLKESSTGGVVARGRIEIALIDSLERAGLLEKARLSVVLGAQTMDPEQQHAEVLAFIGKRLHELGEPAAQEWYSVLEQRSSHPQLRAWADGYYAEQLLQKGEAKAALSKIEQALEVSRDPELIGMLKILQAKGLHVKGDTAAAITAATTLLSDRSFRGREHAEVLLLLAEWEATTGRWDRARGYLQRVCMLYQAFPEYVQLAEQMLEAEHG